MEPLLFGDFFYGLRRAGLKVGLSEWMTLLEALSQQAIGASLVDFYYVARAILVKTEANYDLYDQVFASIFGGKQLPVAAVDHLLAWLDDAEKNGFSVEALQKLEQQSLEQLRKMFEERLRQQKERHDGGSRWVGTGGTSPFGNAGANPAGVRVAGSGGGKSAIQIATAREYRPYRHDRLLDDRAVAVALKKLRKLSRRHADLDLDIDETIDLTSKNAGELELAWRPPRKNEARVILMMDTGGSMDPFAELVEQLFSAAHGLDHWRRFEAYAFHNCVYETLEPGRRGKDDEIATAELIHDRPSESHLIIVGDAYMAPSELLERWGAVNYGQQNPTPGLVWLHRLRQQFPHAVWLNPIPEAGWYGWTIKIINRIFPMYPLTVDGIDDAVSYLVKATPAPLAPLSELFPDLARHGYPLEQQ